MEIISSSIGASGKAFPGYLKDLEFASQAIKNIKDFYILIPVIANDFDSSFSGNWPGDGHFFFKESDGSFIHKPYPKSFKNISRKLFLNYSAFSRYFLINLEGHRYFYSYPLCKLWSNCKKDENKGTFLANIIEESKTENPDRYKKGFLASNYFIKGLKKLRLTRIERAKTILIFDADRRHIYDPRIPKSNFFHAQRNYLIDLAIKNGFSIIDLENVFRKSYSGNGLKFEFINDAHWNENAHKIVANQVLMGLQKIKRTNSPVITFKVDPILSLPSRELVEESPQE